MAFLSIILDLVRWLVCGFAAAFFVHIGIKSENATRKQDRVMRPNTFKVADWVAWVILSLIIHWLFFH